MILHTDGGARGNPGPGAIGAVLSTNSGELIAEKGNYLGACTNNEAEYHGLILGLTMALEQDDKDLSCYLDSELVVKQLNGVYKVKNERMAVLHTKVMNLAQNFDSVTFNHVPRAKNKRADQIVNDVLDSAMTA